MLRVESCSLLERERIRGAFTFNIYIFYDDSMGSSCKSFGATALVEWDVD